MPIRESGKSTGTTTAERRTERYKRRLVRWTGWYFKDTDLKITFELIESALQEIEPTFSNPDDAKAFRLYYSFTDEGSLTAKQIAARLGKSGAWARFLVIRTYQRVCNHIAKTHNLPPRVF
jgi:hypothetical protein